MVLLLAGLLLAVGTPVWLAYALGLEVYLLHPVILVLQAAPYLLAGALWLPRRTQPASSIGQWVAGALLAAALLLYVPMLTGLGPRLGGDMVALLFAGIDAVTALAVLLAAAIAHAALYVRRRRRQDPSQPAAAPWKEL